MKHIYTFRLSILNIVAIVFSGLNYSHIYYYTDTLFCGKIVKVMLYLRILRSKPIRAEFNVGSIRDEEGGCVEYSVENEITKVCSMVRENEFANSVLIRNIGCHLPIEKIFVYLDKHVFRDIREVVVFINYAIWNTRDNLCGNPENIVIFLERDLWSKYLVLFFSEKGLRVIETLSVFNSFYRNILSKLYNLVISPRLYLKLLVTTRGFILKYRNRERIAKVKASSICNGYPVVSAIYTGRKITLDTKERSDFFWLIKSEIPHNRVLIIVDYIHKDNLLSLFDLVKLNPVQTRAPLLSNKDRPRKDEPPVWKPSPLYKKELKSNIGLLVRSCISRGIRFNTMFMHCLMDMTYFMIQYSYWYDFFVSNNIKVNLNKNSFLTEYVPFNAALEKSGGVSIHYQESCLGHTNGIHSIASDIAISFSPHFQFVWAENNSSLDYSVSCGYITDHSFKEVKENADNLRNQLLRGDVDFILCFLDENSSDGRLVTRSNKRNVYIYKYFLQKVLSDKTLGIIFKPKAYDTLFHRLLPISDLIKEARDTQRCIFVDDGEDLISDRFPSETAQAADLCIGLLTGGTTVLEAYLSNTPSVFLDLECLYSSDVYKWGRGKVVFDDIDNLYRAIQKYRQNPDSIPGFGNLDSWVKERDPFRDGKASLRMGQYINWVYRKLADGDTRNEAIEYANRNFAKSWGKNNIVKFR